MEFDSPADFAIKTNGSTVIDLNLTVDELDAILENDVVMTIPPVINV